MRSLFFISVAFLTVSYFGSAARAADCGPLKRAISLDLQTDPGGETLTVPVTINGVQKQLVLDTWSVFTQLSRKTVNQMGLRVETSHRVFYDLYGNAGNGAYTNVDLGVGPQAIKGFASLIQPDPNSTVDGVFAGDLMSHYDIEMDFSGRKLNYFLPDHCEGQAVYWPASAIAVVPFNGWVEVKGVRTRMKLPVTLDGHDITATVDTGSPNTTLNADSARSVFDVTSESSGAVPMGTMDGDPDHKTFGWVFKKLQIGDITVTNPRIQIIPNLLGKKGQDALNSNSRAQRITDGREPDLLLGMDVLKRLHLYIAYEERKLYVTTASAAAPPPAAQAASSGQ